MNCRRCSNALNENWNYCPKCGEKTIVVSSNQVVSSQIIPLQLGSVKINVIRRDQQAGSKDELMRFSAEVVEPESELVEDESGAKMKIKLPGVKDSASIVLKRVGDSVELSAYAGTKRYFKIINMEKLDVVKREFSPEMLVLTLA